MAIQDRVLVFHDYANCPGIITSVESGGITELYCAECRRKLGTLDAPLIEQLLELLPQTQKRA